MHLLSPELEAYVEGRTSIEPDHLKELSTETRANIDMPQMLSGHVQGRFLSLMSWLLRPMIVVDIGTFTGYSALCLAEGLADGGMVHTIDADPTREEMVQRYVQKAGLGARITTHHGSAIDVIPTVEGSFDLVFIDADKENYSNYFDLVVDRVRSGGLIIADNVLWSGRVVDPQREQDNETRALVSYSSKVNADPRVENVLLPLRDGLLVSRKK